MSQSVLTAQPHALNSGKLHIFIIKNAKLCKKEECKITSFFCSYGVSAVVDGEEGPKTEFLGDKVPPKNGVNSQPILDIEQKYNTTVIFLLRTPDFNQKCEV